MRAKNKYLQVRNFFLIIIAPVIKIHVNAISQPRNTRFL